MGHVQLLQFLQFKQPKMYMIGIVSLLVYSYPVGRLDRRQKDMQKIRKCCNIEISTHINYNWTTTIVSISLLGISRTGLFLILRQAN